MARRQDNSIRIGVACLVALSACAALEPPPKLAPPPDLTLHQVRISQFHRGVLTAKISTEELQYTRDTGHLEGRNGTLLPQAGSMAGGHLQAGLTVGSTRSGKADLSEQVHWLGPGGDRVDTSACAVDFLRQVVKGQEPVTMEGAGYTVAAQSFESRYGAGSEIHLRGGVHLHVAQDSDEGSP